MPTSSLPKSPRRANAARPYTNPWHLATARQWLCERYLRLLATGYSLRQSAFALNVSVSTFSGDDCLLARYRRAGVAGLLPRRRGVYRLPIPIMDELAFLAHVKAIQRTLGEGEGWQ